MGKVNVEEAEEEEKQQEVKLDRLLHNDNTTIFHPIKLSAVSYLRNVSLKRIADKNLYAPLHRQSRVVVAIRVQFLSLNSTIITCTIQPSFHCISISLNWYLLLLLFVQ